MMLGLCQFALFRNSRVRLKKVVVSDTGMKMGAFSKGKPIDFKTRFNYIAFAIN